jgi:hypothetical protein
VFQIVVQNLQSYEVALLDLLIYLCWIFDENYALFICDIYFYQIGYWRSCVGAWLGDAPTHAPQAPAQRRQLHRETAEDAVTIL